MAGRDAPPFGQSFQLPAVDDSSLPVSIGWGRAGGDNIPPIDVVESGWRCLEVRALQNATQIICLFHFSNHTLSELYR
jgi:hypothetical protein